MGIIQIAVGVLLILFSIGGVTQQDNRHNQAEVTSFYLKTKIAHSFSVQPQRKSRLSCRGLKPTKWQIKMNMKNKRMWVKIEDEGSYSLPVTYSQWNRKSHKRMIVIAEKGRKHVKATLHRNQLCRRNFLRARYTYSINATISRSQFLSGCCADISR